MTEAEPTLPPARRWRAWGIWTGKLGLTLLLLILAFRKVPLGQLASAWGRLRLGEASLAVLAYLPLCVLVESARLWAAGRRVAAPRLRLGEWAAAFLESRPWFYLLPAATGADAVVWYRLRSRGWSHGGCGFAVLSVRLWGLTFWSIVAALALVFVPETRGILAGVPAWCASPWLWGTAGTLAAAGCLSAPRWLARREHVDLLSTPLADGLLHLGLAALSGLVTAGSVWLAARSAGLELSLPACLGLLAWLNFAMALPISLGGLGLQEALVLRLGLPMGLPAAPLLAFSGLVHLMRALLALAGGLAALKDPLARTDA